MSMASYLWATMSCMKLTSRLTSAMILIETKECKSDGDNQYRSGEERRGEERTETRERGR